MAQKNSTVKILNNDYYRQQTTAANQKTDDERLQKKHRRRMQLLLATAIVLTLICSVQIVKNYLSARQIQVQTQSAKAELKGQTEQQKNLGLQVKQLKDPEYLEKFIRERYFYSKKNETIYNLPESRSQGVNNQK